jgi:prevent-host-death family protein
MSITVSAADANRKFSELLRRVREGQSYTVTSHGRPVAKIVPADAPADPDRKAAWDRLMARLQSQPARTIGRWSREALYERE